jgi:hypothetical protein
MSTEVVTGAPTRRVWGALRRFVQPAPRVERCELCSLELPEEHPHLVEPAARQLLCVCQACGILFSEDRKAKYRRVSDKSRFLAEFRLSDAQWNTLAIPVGLVFFFHSSPMDKVVAIYPSPAGPTESLLELDVWQEIVVENPILREMKSDVEALLVHRIEGAREYYLAPIDECYKLVGLLRARWQGFSGGDEAWDEICRFLERMKNRSTDGGLPGVEYA